MAYQARHIKTAEIQIIKQILAQKLYKNKIDQNTISALLNLSQPTVSNYLKMQKTTPQHLEQTIQEILEQLMQNKTIHISSLLTFEPIPTGNFFLAQAHELNTPNRSTIIDHLNEAYKKLNNINISPLNPAVKINLAESLPAASNKNDIASYHSGLILANSKIINHNGITFGTSNHLSTLLLQIKKKYPKVNAIMNLAYPKQLTKLKTLTTSKLTKEYLLETCAYQPDLLLHPGSFGIEPCAYLIGKDANEVAEKLHLILEEMKA